MGFSELLIVALVSIIVLGPKRLPGAIKQVLFWYGRVKRFIQSVKEDLEKELEVDEIKRELYNEEVIKKLKKEEGAEKKEGKNN